MPTTQEKTLAEAPAQPTAKAYPGLFRFEEPVRIWTPDGSYDAPKLMAISKTPISMKMEQTAKHLRSQTPRQRIITFGESFQYMLRLEGMEDGEAIAEDMITGPYESTSTIAVYTGARKSDKGFYHGLLVQIPLFDSEGRMIFDKKDVPKGRHRWELALPAKSDYVNKQPKECYPFLNALYGMEDAKKRLPPNAFIDVWPEGGLNIFLRGNWHFFTRERRRVDAYGRWRPSDSDGDVASRGAAEGRMWREMDEDTYKSIMESVAGLKKVPLSEAAEHIARLEAELVAARFIQEEI